MITIRCTACSASWRQLDDAPVPDQCDWCLDWECLYVVEQEEETP